MVLNLWEVGHAFLTLYIYNRSVRNLVYLMHIKCILTIRTCVKIPLNCTLQAHRKAAGVGTTVAHFLKVAHSICQPPPLGAIPSYAHYFPHFMSLRGNVYGVDATGT
jgi:hypothetical protein